MQLAVTPLCCGSITLDKSILTVGAAGVEVEVPSIVYLVEAEETILVDTSFGDTEQMNELHPAFECQRTADQALSNALGRHGYEPADIDIVILTHLHWDHCYNLDRFEHAEICVQRTELEYAIAPYPMHADGYEAKSLGRTPPWLTVDLTPLEGETPICSGVTAFPTPGHTVGHQSVVVETDEDTTVIAADAIPTFENAEGTDKAPFIRGLAVNDFDWWQSANQITDRGGHILPGHEWDIVDTERDTNA